MFRRISQFIAGIKGELKKTTWPWESDPKITGFKKYRELWGSTMVVLIAMIFLGAFVASFDVILAYVINHVISFTSQI
ncbi:MAG: preprotein translocase subunit SecE [Akkermansia sp.]